MKNYLPLLFTSILLTSCSGWKPPVEPKAIAAWREEVTSSNCGIKPIEDAKNCATQGFVPDVNWVYFGEHGIDNAPDEKLFTYFYNWKKDMTGNKYDEGKQFIVFTNLLIHRLPSYDGTHLIINVNPMRLDCSEEGGFRPYFWGSMGIWERGSMTVEKPGPDTMPQSGEVSKQKVLYNSFEYMCNTAV